MNITQNLKRTGLFELIISDKLKNLTCANVQMQWPLVSWQGRNKVMKALNNIVRHCKKYLLVCNALSNDKSRFVYLYKITEASHNNTWIAFWLHFKEDKIWYIEAIFDTFSKFNHNNTAIIFGYKKELPEKVSAGEMSDNTSLALDAIEQLIVDQLKQFFWNQYQMPVQDTLMARQRLYRAAKHAKAVLESKQHANIVLPFFSANKIGPIQFCAKITRNGSNYRVSPL